MSDQAPVTEADLQAYADGRLSEERRATVQAWLEARPEEAERMAEYRRLAEELRATFDPVLAEPVPRALERFASRRARWRRAAALGAALALGAILGAVGGWQLRGSHPELSAYADTSVIARRAAVAHAVYAPEVRHPVEVGSDQEQHLVAWLSKRLGVKLRAPKLDEAGMSLVGGRLLPGESGPVAQLMYQSQGGRRLTLYWRPERGAKRESAFRYARENNVGVFYWIDQESGYAIASADLSKEELLRVATLVYKQLEP
jgi:anti-sigma factor RsiW